MSDLTARRPDFHSQNLFFLALLGLLAGSSALRALLERHGRSADGEPTAPTSVDVDGDPVLAVALGVVALRERLLAHVSTALTAPARTTAADDAAPTPSLRTMLR